MGRGANPFLAGYGTFLSAWNHFSLSYLANTGKDRCGVDTSSSLPLSVVTYWIICMLSILLISIWNWNLNFVRKQVSLFFSFSLDVTAVRARPSRVCSKCRIMVIVGPALGVSSHQRCHRFLAAWDPPVNTTDDNFRRQMDTQVLDLKQWNGQTFGKTFFLVLVTLGNGHSG